MGWFGDDSDQAQAYDQAVNKPHEAQWSHELIAGAAAFEAEKAWQKHEAAQGKPSSHGEAKDFIAGLTGVFVDKIVETHGLDFIDKEKAKHQAREQTERHVNREYGVDY
ncbi:hypothetical protein EIP91_006707 [Steccherinum ochraceum]|uniref:CipC-like antibiotic response protein n=1 Tax=Steccherinum ochraceum TaxID=92696 RepID=A0A4R0RLT5_9APHY|nr:hypothetical protein EIP91_006707 [Steccherinum ochraceum]